MDAEKNVVEAARKLTDAVYAEHFGSSYKRVLVDCLLVNKLQAALSAYDAARKDSAPAPSEDRVREAAGEYEFVLTGEVREPKVGEWYVEHYGAQVATIDWPEHKANKRSILHRRVTPAPALPAGTVAVSVETLREIRRDAVSTHTMEGYPESSCSIAKTIDAIIPPAPRPEPPKELVEKWEREAMEYAWEAPVGITPRAAYVAALRAAWEADPKGKQ